MVIKKAAHSLALRENTVRWPTAWPSLFWLQQLLKNFTNQRPKLHLCIATTSAQPTRLLIQSKTNKRSMLRSTCTSVSIVSLLEQLVFSTCRQAHIKLTYSPRASRLQYFRDFALASICSGAQFQLRGVLNVYIVTLVL
jgi:hypothetical protein